MHPTLGVLLSLLPVSMVAAVGDAAKPQVQLETSHGVILLELYPDQAPKTVANFLEYTNDGFYDGTVFHRVIDGFMIQGGGFTRSLKKKITRDPVENEAGNGLGNEPGTVAMARTGDPHSATAQFFINVANNEFLNRAKAQDGFGYTVFGKVVAGMDVVEEIAKVQTGFQNGMRDVPQEPVVIQKAVVVD